MVTHAPPFLELPRLQRQLEERYGPVVRVRWTMVRRDTRCARPATRTETLAAWGRACLAMADAAMHTRPPLAREGARRQDPATVPEACFVMATFATEDAARAALSAGEVEYGTTRRLPIQPVHPSAFGADATERHVARARCG